MTHPEASQTECWVWCCCLQTWPHQVMSKPTTTVEVPRANRSHALSLGSEFSQQCSEADAVISLTLRVRKWKLQEIELLIQVPCLDSDLGLACVTTLCCYPACRLPGPGPILGREGTGARDGPSIPLWATGWITKPSDCHRLGWSHLAAWSGYVVCAQHMG